MEQKGLFAALRLLKLWKIQVEASEDGGAANLRGNPSRLGRLDRLLTKTVDGRRGTLK